MVWEQDSRVIVMLTHLMEKGSVSIEFRFKKKKKQTSYLLKKEKNTRPEK
jgi:hypothetical protein